MRTKKTTNVSELKSMDGCRDRITTRRGSHRMPENVFLRTWPSGQFGWAVRLGCSGRGNETDLPVLSFGFWVLSSDPTQNPKLRTQNQEIRSRHLDLHDKP